MTPKTPLLARTQEEFELYAEHQKYASWFEKLNNLIDAYWRADAAARKHIEIELDQHRRSTP